MNALMAKSARPRLIIDTEEELRRAVQIRAASTGRSVSEILNEIIRDLFKAEITQAKKAMRDGDDGDD